MKIGLGGYARVSAERKLSSGAASSLSNERKTGSDVLSHRKAGWRAYMQANIACRAALNPESSSHFTRHPLRFT